MFTKNCENNSETTWCKVTKKLGGSIILSKNFIAHIRANVSRLNLTTSVGILTLALFTILFSASVFGKSVTVNVDGDEKKMFIFGRTVSDALSHAGISVSENDELSNSLDEVLYNGQRVYVEKAFPISLSVNGVLQDVYTTGKSVSSFLAEKEIILSEHDVVTPSLNTHISENENIVLQKAEVSIVKENESIPFETKTVKNSALASGKTNVKTEGSNGLREVSYTVVRRNGELISKTICGTEIVKQPVDKVLESGTMVAQNTTEKKSNATVSKPAAVQATVASRSGEQKRGKRVITMKATAYDLSFESSGVRPGQPGYGVTASGMKARYGVVAVDPKVIPLGTKLYIESVDGKFVYGDAVAGDTGGAIKGNRIDLFMNTRQECMNFGVRQVNVYILD